MGFKKHSWIKYGRQGEIVQIKVLDSAGGKIDSFQCNSNEDYVKILRLIKRKYGYDYKFKEEDSKNDINWLKEDLEW